MLAQVEFSYGKDPGTIIGLAIGGGGRIRAPLQWRPLTAKNRTTTYFIA